MFYTGGSLWYIIVNNKYPKLEYRPFQCYTGMLFSSISKKRCICICFCCLLFYESPDTVTEKQQIGRKTIHTASSLFHSLIPGMLSSTAFVFTVLCCPRYPNGSFLCFCQFSGQMSPLHKCLQ